MFNKSLRALLTKQLPNLFFRFISILIKKNNKFKINHFSTNINTEIKQHFSILEIRLNTTNAVYLKVHNKYIL